MSEEEQVNMICPHCKKPFFPCGNVYECPNIYHAIEMDKEEKNPKKKSGFFKKLLAEERGKDYDTNVYVIACRNCHKVVSVINW